MSNVLEIALLIAVLGMLFLLFKIQRGIDWLFKSRLSKQDLQFAYSQHRIQEQARLYLGTLLNLNPARLPPFGGWSASADILTLVAEHALQKKPQVVVEFGSGLSTLVIARCLQLNGTGRLVTYEHDKEFASATRQRVDALGLSVDIRVVELSAAEPLGYAGLWYATGEVPDGIDLLIIDGPPSQIHPETRGAAAALFTSLSSRGTIILDDAARPGEKAIAERWRREFNNISFRYLGTEKGTLVGTKA